MCHPRVLFATLCLLAGSAGDGLDSCEVPQPHPQRTSCLKLGPVPGSSQRVYSAHLLQAIHCLLSTSESGALSAVL